MKNQIIIELKQYMYNLIKISDKYRNNEVDIDILRESIRKLQCKLRTIQNVTDTSNIQELESDIATLKIQINNIKHDIGTLNEGAPDLQTQINNNSQGGGGSGEPGETHSQCTCGTDIAALKAAIDGTADGEELGYNNDKNIDERLTELEGKPGCNCEGISDKIDKLNQAIISTTADGTTLSYTGNDISTRLTDLESKVEALGDGIGGEQCNCSDQINAIKAAIDGTAADETLSYDTGTKGTIDARLADLENKVGHPATNEPETDANGLYALIDNAKCNCDCDGINNKINALNAAINPKDETNAELNYTNEKNIDERLTDLESKDADLQTQIGDIKDKGSLQDQIDTINQTIEQLGTGEPTCDCSDKIAALNAAIDGTGADGTLSYDTGAKGTIDTRLTDLETKDADLQTQIGDTTDKDPLQDQIDAINQTIAQLGTEGTTCDCSDKIAALNAAIDGTGADGTLSYDTGAKGTIDARLTALEGKPECSCGEINSAIEEINNKIGEIKIGDGQVIISLQTQIDNIKQCNCNCAEEISEIKGIIGGTNTDGVVSYNIDTEGGTLDARLEALEQKVGDPINTDGSNNIIPLQDQIGHPATTDINGAVTQEATGIYKIIDDNKCTCTGGGSSDITCDTIRLMFKAEKEDSSHAGNNYSESTGHCGHICEGFKAIITNEDKCTNICDAIGTLIQHEINHLSGGQHCNNICNALRLLIENESTCDNMCNAIKQLIIHERDHKSDRSHCTNICSAIKDLLLCEKEKGCGNIDDAMGQLISNGNNMQNAIKSCCTQYSTTINSSDTTTIKDALINLLENNNTVKNAIKSIADDGIPAEAGSSDGTIYDLLIYFITRNDEVKTKIKALVTTSQS